MTSVDELVAGISRGDQRLVGRAMSLVEAGADDAWELLRRRYPKGGHAHIIGLTGAPGVGKSTLIDGLIASYRAYSRSVGVILVDATSPFTGGAVLGVLLPSTVGALLGTYVQEGIRRVLSCGLFHGGLCRYGFQLPEQ